VLVLLTALVDMAQALLQVVQGGRVVLLQVVQGGRVVLLQVVQGGMVVQPLVVQVDKVQIYPAEGRVLIPPPDCKVEGHSLVEEVVHSLLEGVHSLLERVLGSLPEGVVHTLVVGVGVGGERQLAAVVAPKLVQLQPAGRLVSFDMQTCKQ